MLAVRVTNVIAGSFQLLFETMIRFDGQPMLHLLTYRNRKDRMYDCNKRNPSFIKMQ